MLIVRRNFDATDRDLEKGATAKMVRWFKVTLLFPLRDNDGNAFPKEVWGWWRDEITTLVTAFTVRGVVTGWWDRRSERNLEVFMVVKTQREVDDIRAFLRRARRKFKQKVMYFEHHPVYFEEVK